MEDHQPPPGGAPPGRAVVLVADGQPLVRQVAELTLKGAGYGVLAAMGADAALHVADAQTGPIDLVIAGADLGAMSGLQVVAALRQRRPRLAAVIVCGPESAAAAAEAARLGIRTLSRPFDVLTLLSVVEAALSEVRR